jgi:NAD-dependent dihydropyrimidine dehydrogenase PreA subunit
MVNMRNHPTVVKMTELAASLQDEAPPPPVDISWLRELVLSEGADDVGFVSIDRPELDDQRDDLLTVYPATKAVVSFVVRMNKESVRSEFRSVANHEFHSSGDDVDHIARRVAKALNERGVPTVNPPMAFPMEMSRFPDGKAWTVSHKPIAVAAGLGQMGIHRNVIHPKFGNFILLGTVLLGVEVTEEQQPIDYNPCFECKLCVAACPVGAIGADGWFDFNACLTHNYREFLGGFNSWVDTIADSRNAAAYNQQMTPGETASMWQSLAYGPNYKAAYCMAVCPAGEDVIAPYLAD